MKEKVQKTKSKHVRHPQCISELANNTGAVPSACYDPAGNFIASCSEDGTVRLFYVEAITSDDHRHFRVKIERDYPTQCCFTPDGSHLVVANRDSKQLHAIKLFKKKNDQGRSYEIKLVYPGKHKADINSIQVSNNSQFVLTCYDDTTFILWNLKAEVLAEINTKQMKNTMAAISPDCKFVAAGTFMSDVKLWLLKYNVHQDKSSFSGIDEAHFTQLSGHTSAVNYLAFLSDSKRMVTCSKDCTWKLWNIDVDYKRDMKPTMLKSVENPDGKEPYTLLAVSPSGKVLTIVSKTNIQIWDLEAAKLVDIITNAHQGTITQLSWSSDSTVFLSACRDCAIRVFKNPLL